MSSESTHGILELLPDISRKGLIYADTQLEAREILTLSTAFLSLPKNLIPEEGLQSLLECLCPRTPESLNGIAYRILKYIEKDDQIEVRVRFYEIRR